MDRTEIQKLQSFESHITLGNTSLHLMVEEFLTGIPRNVFLISSKSGSDLDQLLNKESVEVSKKLRLGIDVIAAVSPWLDKEFDPKGAVEGDKYIKRALSPLDYAAKAMLLHYKKLKQYAENPESVDSFELRGYRSGAFRYYCLK